VDVSPTECILRISLRTRVLRRQHRPDRRLDDMRHLIGFGLALVVAAAVFFGAAWGYLRLLRIPVVNGAAGTLPANGGSLLHDGSVLWAFAALAAVALLIGVCVTVTWISPLAAGLPGLVLIGVTIWYEVNVQQAVRYIPLRGDAFGDGFEAMLFNGILAAAGLIMVVPMCVPSRWVRRGGQPGDQTPDAVPATSASTLLSSDWSETAPIPPTPPTDLWS
jgi:hypothetical protein